MSLGLVNSGKLWCRMLPPGTRGFAHSFIHIVFFATVNQPSVHLFGPLYRPAKFLVLAELVHSGCTAIYGRLQSWRWVKLRCSARSVKHVESKRFESRFRLRAPSFFFQFERDRSSTPCARRILYRGLHCSSAHFQPWRCSYFANESDGL